MRAKELCLLGYKGKFPPQRLLRFKDVIEESVREQSRKPEQLYHIAEQLKPHGCYVELFGREWNCRPGWLTLGMTSKNKDKLLTEKNNGPVDIASAV